MTRSLIAAWLRGISSPASLIIAVATAALAYFVSPYVIIPGVVIFLLSAHYSGPRRQARDRHIHEQGLDMKDAPPGLKRWNTLLNEALSRLQTDLQQVPADRARLMRPIAAEIEALTGDVRQLLRQSYRLHRYLNGTNQQMVRARLEHLRSQIAVTQDTYSKQQLVEAAEALERQLENCEHIRVLIGRTEATLENMQATLQAIGSSIVRLGAAELSAADMAGQESLQRLSSARTSVASLEAVLQQAEVSGVDS